MRYCTTRNGEINASFETVLLQGVPSDGSGLFVPREIPIVSVQQLQTWSTLPFPELSLAIAELFINQDEIPRGVLRDIIIDSYASFPSEVIPLKQLGNSNVFAAELFHGPSLAFKDIAMFVTGRLLDYFLQKRGRKATVVVATSGDTGPSCLMALEGLAHVRTIVVFPSKRVSSRQAMQMTNRTPSNSVKVFEVEESTSDLLDTEIFKLFGDKDLTSRAGLCSLNSVNWSRVLFQIPLFFFVYFQARKDHRVMIALPTGAMGNSVAGVIAMKLGLPIEKLILAQNENDCAVHFLRTNIIQFNAKQVVSTVAPAIDIQSPYNIERLLWAICSHTSSFERINSWMKQVDKGQAVHVDLTPDECTWKDSHLIGSSFTQKQILKVMHQIKSAYNVVLDPHTAVAACASFAVARPKRMKDSSVVYCLMATAHPCKFPEVFTNRLEWISQSLKEESLYDIPVQMKTILSIPPNRIVVHQNKLGNALRLAIDTFLSASPNSRL